MDSIHYELGRHRAEKFRRGSLALRLLGTCAVLILALQLGACSGEPGSSGGSGGSGATVPPAVVPDIGCTPNWPRRDSPRAQTSEELKYVDLIVACVNDSTGSVSLTNKSDMVWAFYSDSAVNVSQEAAELKVKEFHALASAGMYAYTFMAPSETISVDSPPASFEWVIHPDLSLAWMTNDFVLKQVGKKTPSALRSALTSGSAVRQAVWDCTKAVYDLALQVPRVLSPQYDPAELIKQGLGIATSSGKCGSSWAAAEKEAAAVAAPLPSFVQMGEEARNALKGSGELAEKSGSLLKGVVALEKSVCKASTRC
ncbi:hypothetical protein PY310_18485 [Pseudarthrobacter sp. H3Y2-7]|uniref:hypothetical protein n=1 Tax=Pseudarthrobacter naphthalenicus TaxID=3031328 RepID=UPI0023AE8280|nr:hypothetical protein [Pseudarthrobacter sp. H3Y2-7]MDE8670571.1 hypothetical protein [Pseudarthrobacter sp. H3Y2-7]